MTEQNRGEFQDAREFDRQAVQMRRGVLAEVADFLLNNKKWWLTPIVLALLLVGALIMLSGTAAAPFIYTLF
jgi:membrane glycosyltransferase